MYFRFFLVALFLAVPAFSYAGIPKPIRVEDVNWQECLDVKFFVEHLLDEFDEKCEETEFRFQAKRVRSFHSDNKTPCIVLQKIEIALREIKNECSECSSLYITFERALSLSGIDLKKYLENLNDRLESKLELGEDCANF